MLIWRSGIWSQKYSLLTVLPSRALNGEKINWGRKAQCCNWSACHAVVPILSEIFLWLRFCLQAHKFRKSINQKKCYAENPAAVHCWEFGFVSQRSGDLGLRLRDPTAAVWGWHFGVTTFWCANSSRENTSGRNMISHTVAGGIALLKLLIHSHLLQVAYCLKIVMSVLNAL